MKRRRHRDQPSPAEAERDIRQQLHITEGILRALDRWTDVSAAAYECASTDDLRIRLSELIGLDDVQATTVMDMQVRRVTRLERGKLAARVLELRAEIARFE